MSHNAGMAKKKSTTKSTGAAAKAPKTAPSTASAPGKVSELLRVGKGFDLSDVDPSGTPGFDGDKKAGEVRLAEHSAKLGDLQERLYAESKGGGKRAILLVVQGMDTSGKGGIMRHVVGAVDPQGIEYRAFKAPTDEERQHDFLWRIRNALPGPGMVGVFDRSQYEDVLIVRVHDLVPRDQWMKRYALINAFEREVVASGTTIVKVMLHISKDEQKARLGERLADPTKHYKYNPGDITERGSWDDYMAAYQAALTKCSTVVAPWFVVPANRKWYARLAVQQLLLEHLQEMNPQWPSGNFDVAIEERRLAES